MGGRDVLDDREAEAGATGGAVPGRVDPVEPLEDPVDLVGSGCRCPGRRPRSRPSSVGLARRPAPWSRRRSRRPRWRPGWRPRRRPARRCRRPRGPASPPVTTMIRGRRRRSALVSTARDHVVDRHRDRRLERVVALQPGQLDDLLHQPGEPVALGQHPAGEPLDRLRVVGGVVDRLGQQPDRADRGLELVADVGDEVAADRLDPALAGAVLDQRQHQPRAQRRDPRGDVAGGHRRSRDIRSSVSRIWPSRRTWRTRSASSSTTSALPRTRPKAYAGAEALRTTSSSSTTTALLRRTERTVATPAGTAGSSGWGLRAGGR